MVSSIVYSQSVLSPTRELEVLQLEPNEKALKQIVTISREWKSIANSKYEEAVGPSKEIFKDLVVNAISLRLKSQPYAISEEQWNTILLCRDVALQQIQAIALVNLAKDSAVLVLLLTHPQNVRSLVNVNETTRVEGAGTALVKYLEALPEIEQISTEALVSSIPFYKKLGFKLIDLEHENAGVMPMELHL